MNTRKDYNIIIIGSGAAGMMSAITAAKSGKKVLLLEKLSLLGAKLKATGGGKCNLTNTLSNEEFMAKFGKNGRFMTHALNIFNHNKLREFFKNIGVDSHAPDGFRVFPITHDSTTILSALEKELKRVKVDIQFLQKVEKITIENGKTTGVETKNNIFTSEHVIVATGGLGYPKLGAQGDGFVLAYKVGHTVTELYPAMTPLITKERWQENCRQDTISKATIKINLKKAKKLKAVGDLIFTKNGIRGPVILDFAREITPFLEKLGEVPLLINMTKGLNQEEIQKHLKNSSNDTILTSVSQLLPLSVATELLKLCKIEPDTKFHKIDGKNRDKLIKLLTWTPMTVIGDNGFEKAMITRGGISLKEIDPNTMQSKLIKGLYFCGEVVDLDGPCGGYNLQWSFASGYLAGLLH